MEPQFYKGNRDAFMEKLAPGKGCVRVSGDPVYSASESDRREMDRSENEAGGD